MTDFEIYVLIGMGVIAFCLFWIAVAIEKLTRHLSNVADRLLDIDRTLAERR